MELEEPLNGVGRSIIFDLGPHGYDFYEALKTFFSQYGEEYAWCSQVVYDGCTRDVGSILRDISAVQIISSRFPFHDTIKDILLAVPNLDHEVLVELVRRHSFSIYLFLYGQLNLTSAQSFIVSDQGISHIVLTEVFSL